MSENVRLIGIPELAKRLERPEWVWIPARHFLEKWGSVVQRQAVANFSRGPGGWIDTAESRKSITHEVDKSEFPIYARAGSNLDKVRWGEYGTGLLSEDPDSPRKRHWPPASALEDWANKRKIPRADDPSRFLTGADIAAIIGLRGGLAPRRFLRNAEESTEPKIEGFLTEFATEIQKEAAHGNR